MIKHIIRITLTIFVTAILFIIVLNHLADDKPKEAMNLSTHASHVQPKEKVPSKYDKIDFFIDTEKNDAYSIQTLFPVTNNEKINNEIDAWIESEKQAFINELPEDSESQATFKLDTTIETESKHYNRLIFHIHKEIEPNENRQQKKIFNVDLEEGRILSLDDFLDVDDQALQEILKHALELIEVDKNMIIEKNTRQTVLTSRDNWDWSMSQNGLTFIFDGAIFPESKKEPVHTTIPLQELYLQIHDQINHYVQLSDKQQEEWEVALQEEKDRILAEKREKEKREQEKAAAKQQQEQATNDPNGKYIALTFDDGPSAEVTPRVLDILKQYDAKATFFMLGSQLDYHPEIAKLVADAGHEIGNHTEQHQDLTTLGPDGIRQEIKSTSDKINSITGSRPYLVRPPYGAYNENLRNDATNQGNSIILWSIDSLDWQTRNADAINREVQQQLTPGSIVLMHDIHPTTADALPELMETLHQKGYQFVTVSQLLKMQGKSGAGPFYGNAK